MSSQAPIVDRIRIIPRPTDFLDRNVGSSGEVFYSKESGSLRVYSGKLAGGYELAKSDLSNVSNELFAAKVSSSGSSGLESIYTADETLDWVEGSYNFGNNIIKYANAIQAESELANYDPATYHGMTMHVHETGALYYAHSGEWRKLLTDTTFNDAVGAGYVDPLASVAYSGSYNDLSDLPDIAGGGASVDVGLTPPTDPTAGNIWFDLNTGKIYVYVDDGDTQQWVQPVAAIGSTFSGDYNDLDNKPNLPTFDGSLVSTDSVTFDTVTASSFVNNGVGNAGLTSASTIDLTAPDGVNVSAALNVAGISTLASTREKIIQATVDTVTNTLTVDYEEGAIYFVTVPPSADFTLDISNVPTEFWHSITMAVVISQGGTAYMPTAVTVNSTAQSSLFYQGGPPPPSGTANGIDVYSLVLLKADVAGNTFNCLISSTSYDN